MKRLLTQSLKFLAVGGVGVVVNLVVFNVLRSTVWNTDRVHLGAIYSTIVATAAAIVLNWIGNRFWAFREVRRESAVREGAEFFLVSLAGLAIPLLCVWMSHYVLGFTSQLADSIANNVIGLAIGTVFRFVLYRWWVYNPNRSGVLEAAGAASGISSISPGD